MAVAKMRYKDLNHSLKLFRGQVTDGLPYALYECPQLDTPEQIFAWLKLRTKYKNDPKNVELFQTLPTLLNNNFHGSTGHGDCDCFTIAALSLLLANGFHNCGIVLVGRNSFTPVHIYAYVDDKGERKYLDLTNKVFNYEREYPYKQHIPFNLTQKEKNMTLQLADGGYTEPIHPYIQLSSEGIQVREDQFDHMSPGAFQKMLLNEGYEPHEIAELSKGRAQRKAAKQEKKAAKPRKQKKAAKLVDKRAKKAAKVEKKKSRAELNRSKGQAKIIKAGAKQTKAENSGGEQDNSADSWINRFGSVTDSVGNVVGAVRGRQQGGDEDSGSYGGGSRSGGGNYGGGSDEETGSSEGGETLTIMGQSIPKKGLYIAGGLLLVGLAAYAYNKNKKRAA